MPTPEVQQYINQQRSAGVSDSQIRQALAQQGWAEDDINAALSPGISSSNTPTTSHKKSWLALSVTIGLLLLGWLGYAAYERRQASLEGCCGDAKQSSQGISPTPTSQGSGSTNSTQKLCGDFPKNATGTKLTQNGNSGSSSTFIKDFP